MRLSAIAPFLGKQGGSLSALNRPWCCAAATSAGARSRPRGQLDQQSDPKPGEWRDSRSAQSAAARRPDPCYGKIPAEPSGAGPAARSRWASFSVRSNLHSVRSSSFQHGAASPIEPGPDTRKKRDSAVTLFGRCVRPPLRDASAGRHRTVRARRPHGASAHMVRRARAAIYVAMCLVSLGFRSSASPECPRSGSSLIEVTLRYLVYSCACPINVLILGDCGETGRIRPK
jgi:hypothetical protein